MLVYITMSLLPGERHLIIYENESMFARKSQQMQLKSSIRYTDPYHVLHYFARPINPHINNPCLVELTQRLGSTYMVII